jgi:gamma-glutamyltranspeptidase/glutathione hydrolase
MIESPFDWQFPYPSQRIPLLARNVVATSQPLAAQAGLRMMLKGGKAVDGSKALTALLTADG